MPSTMCRPASRVTRALRCAVSLLQHGIIAAEREQRRYRKERKDWEVLIPNHHEGYLSWADYETNLAGDCRQCQWKDADEPRFVRRGAVGWFVALRSLW